MRAYDGVGKRPVLLIVLGGGGGRDEGVTFTKLAVALGARDVQLLALRTGQGRAIGGRNHVAVVAPPLETLDHVRLAVLVVLSVQRTILCGGEREFPRNQLRTDRKRGVGVTYLNNTDSTRLYWDQAGRGMCSPASDTAFYNN